MPSIEEYISQYAGELPDMEVEEAEASASGNTLLTGILLGASNDYLTFSHLGLVFLVKKADVIRADQSNDPIPNPYGKGVTTTLLLSEDAVITRTVSVRARDVAQALPYVVSRPSRIQPFGQADIEARHREMNWLSQRGLNMPTEAEIVPRASFAGNTAATTYTGTDSSQITHTRSDSTSGGMTDDTTVDDSNSDGMGRDDANQDDISSDLSLATNVATTTYTGTDSSQITHTRSDTTSGGMTDDSSVDDSNSDGMGRDDANPDDMS